MDYNLIVTLPVTTANALTDPQKKAAAEALHNALSQAHEDLDVYAEVGYNEATNSKLFSVGEAFVTIEDAPGEASKQVFVLGYSWQGSNDIVDVFGTLEDAQKRALEGVQKMADQAPEGLEWTAPDEDAPTRLRAEHEDMQYIIETRQLL